MTRAREMRLTNVSPLTSAVAQGYGGRAARHEPKGKRFNDGSSKPPFPLTPALSLRERETRLSGLLPGSAVFGVHGANARNFFSRKSLPSARIFSAPNSHIAAGKDTRSVGFSFACGICSTNFFMNVE